MEMEWNTKWDWENYVNFCPKAIESPKKLQLADWMIVDDGEFHGGSHNLSGGSSAKSSVSASTDSSTKEGVQTPSFRFEGTSGNLSKKVEVSGTSNASVGSTEALLGLKLGKRTYFENSNGGSVKSSTSLSAMPTPATTTMLKKTKSSAQNAPVCCQVEKCNVDLSKAKEYHRKHRVCDFHSKYPKVTVAGRERRFCQQCSRFHSLSEFDEKKRSCRRRLSDHNARRRKPQQETMQFESTRLASPFYGGNQQMSFLLNNSALVHSKTPGNCGWDNSKFTLSKGYSWKSNGGTDKQLHMPGIKNPQSIITMQNAANGLLVSKNSTPLVSDPGSKGSMISPLDAAPEYRRALSLLSNNSWDSCEPESILLHHQMQENDSTIMQQPIIHAIPEGVPLSSSEFWLSGLSGQHSTQSLPTNSNFQEIQHFKTPYDADFYSNMLN